MKKLRTILLVISTIMFAIVVLIWAWTSAPNVMSFEINPKREICIEPDRIVYYRLHKLTQDEAREYHHDHESAGVHGEPKHNKASQVDPDYPIYQGIAIYSVPYYPLAIAFGIGPLLAMILHYRRRSIEKMRLRSGLCQQCGYNIAFTPDRCPECGTVPQKTIHLK